MITVIVAVLNDAGNIRQALDSIVSQTYPDLEAIVIDGGSTDGTRDILTEYAEHLSSYCSEPDRGIYDAWNKGLTRCHGDWIIFHGADDRFSSNHSLDEAAALLASVPPRFRLAHGNMVRVAKDGRTIGMVGGTDSFDRNAFYGRMTLPHPAVFYRREYFQTHGCFDTGFQIAGDYDMLLREIKSAQPFYFDLTVSRMQAGGISDNPDHGMLQIRERFRALRKNGMSGLRPVLIRQALGESLFHTCSKLLGSAFSQQLRNRYRQWRPFAKTDVRT